LDLSRTWSRTCTVIKIDSRPVRVFRDPLEFSGQQANATVTLTGCFTQQDSVTLASSGAGNVTVGAVTPGMWGNTGGTFTFPLTGQTPGAFTLTAVDTQFGSPPAVASNNAVTLAAISLSSNGIQEKEGDAYMGQVATLTDAAGPYSSGNYTITFTLNGQQYGVQITNVGVGTYAINLAQALPCLSAGTCTATVSAIEAGTNGASDATASTPVTIDVADVPISAEGVNFGVKEGVPWNGEIATFTDPDPLAQIADYSGTIDYGDGSPISGGTISQDVDGNWLVSGAHTYAQLGSFTATIKIYDIGGAYATCTAAAEMICLGIDSANVPNNAKMSDGAVIVPSDLSPQSAFVPVSLYVSDNVPDGTPITLSIVSGASEAAVVQGGTADPSDPVFLGGSGPSQYTWYAGSGGMDDLWLWGLAASQSQCDIVLAQTMPVTQPSSQPTTGPTTQVTDQAAATVYLPQIDYTADGGGPVNITNKVGTDAPAVLPGQLVSLSLNGDGNLAAGILWSTDESTFKDYTTTRNASTGDSVGKVVPLADADWGNRNANWYYQPTNPDASAAVACDGTIKGKPFHIESAFRIYEPTSSLTMTWVPIGAGLRPVIPNSGGIQPAYWGFGMTFTLNVDNTMLLAPLDGPGTFYLTQLVTCQFFATDVQTDTLLEGAWNSRSDMLDGAIGINLGAKTFATGAAAGTYTDSPGLGIGFLLPNGKKVDKYSWVSMFYEFTDYLMFKPPGAQSKPVALRMLHSSAGTGAYRPAPVNGVQQRWTADPDVPQYELPGGAAVVSDPTSKQPEWVYSDMFNIMQTYG
jgi:hypothetical protein